MSIIPHARLRRLQGYAMECVDVPGAVAEVGVYRGGSAAVLAHIFGTERRMLLYDTFTGLPESGEYDGDHLKQGQFDDVSIDDVRKLIPHAQIIVGEFDEQLVPNLGFAFVHIDVDLFEPTFDALDAFWPKLMPGGRIVVDDAGNERTPGATCAVERWLSVHPMLPPEWHTWPAGGGWTVRKRNSSYAGRRPVPLT